MLAAALGWCVACLLEAISFACVSSYQDYRNGVTHRDLVAVFSLGMYIFWLCTGLFTLFVTAALVVPYVSLRSDRDLLGRPWRLYVDTALAGVACLTALMLYQHPAAFLHLHYYAGFLGDIAVALTTSCLSSYFFLRLLRRSSRSALRAD